MNSEEKPQNDGMLAPAAQPVITRIRRGKVVGVPPKWVGKITTAETIRQRPSKLIGKVKRAMKRKLIPSLAYKDEKDTPLPD